MMSELAIHKHYMLRCLELAKSGLGKVAPNPLVGCVIVYKDKIIGEGFHRKYGGPHAEVHAVNSVIDDAKLKESTLYVNLEPCSHYGKTPPCTDLIIRKKIKKVVIGCRDVYAEVDGKGIEKLKKAGIEVITGVLEEESREINKRFFTYHQKKRPYIILKWAQTLDGFIDKRRDHRKVKDARITNEISRSLVHKWRTEEQGIMVGTETAIADNPKLNVRNWTGKNPLRIAVDRSLRIPETHHLLDRSVPTLIFCEKEKENKENLKFYKINFANQSLQEMLDLMYKNNIQSIIVEGGEKLLNSFIKIKDNNYDF